VRLVAIIVLPVLGAGCMTASQSARHPGLAAAQLPAIVPAWAMVEDEFKNRAGYSLSPDGSKLAGRRSSSAIRRSTCRRSRAAR